MVTSEVIWIPVQLLPSSHSTYRLIPGLRHKGYQWSPCRGGDYYRNIYELVRNTKCALLLLTSVHRLVYTLVQRHIRKLQGIPPEVDELAAEAIEDFGEEEPLLRSTSPEPSNRA